MSDKEEAMDDCVRFNDEEMKEEDDDSECYENLDEESDSDSEDDDNDSQDEGDAVEEDVLQGPQQTYLPGKPLEEGEELVCDENAYLMFHKANTGAPCLSFDIIPDGLGAERTDFPHTAYLLSGTQASTEFTNRLIVMKMSNMQKTQPESDSEDSDEEDEETTMKPDLECAIIHHQGSVNRVRMCVVGDKPLAASWSETGKVYLWDLTHPLKAVNDPVLLKTYVENKESPRPLFTFKGHTTEGFAMDWSVPMPGVLATGDCKKNIHIWKPSEGGLWVVDQRPLVGHNASVEDLQWSPNEPNVLASCSVDRSIRIWDTRVQPGKACMLTAANAHENDINVINWNKREPFILSGGDDGKLHVWDLRQFQAGTPVATFKHHTAPITSVEWHPTDSTVFASAGADDQIALWDLALEKDEEVAGSNVEPELADLPPQLLFIHQGQKEIKELHWHPQIPGMLISTAITGFNIFKTISV
ncbi:glutamate-rich WD repeat-containing protein 1 [Daphnia magna]|uniref:Glutamate-rich WD repeat-containing protein 1 n=1 Tax=Daphnia magna TaxID=35525 RepID=A0A0P5S9D2_9CRUS|nr:glutamate-rich WD repeat-containing protein 1 [Daphnia magna]KZS12453.1 putative Histone-binding protein Caf1 [Daphnia magna]